MLLAIDTATRMLGIGLHDGEQVISECVWSARGHHTIELAPEVGKMLRRSGGSVSDLEAIAVAQGPGSYTGLRIGMAFAKGLALVESLPLVGIPTLDVHAFPQQGRKEPMFVFIPAGRGRIAGQWYKWGRNRWSPAGDPENLSWDEFLDGLEAKAYLCGELDHAGYNRLQAVEMIELASPANRVRRPGCLAELAWEKLSAKKKPTPDLLIPDYLEPVGE